jgi:predicted dehydrogenase
MSAIPSKKKIRIAIIGTGGMANLHATRFQAIPGCQVVAACDIDSDRAAAFAERHGIPTSYGSVKSLFASDSIDAVSIVTPDAAHMPVALQSLRRGLHVLCEKPLAVTGPDARKMAAAAKKAGVVHMVNFSYRDWPCIQAAAALIRKGTIGDIRHVEASYLQAWLASKIWGDWRTTPAWLWRLSEGHGSRGVLGDVGVHIVDYTTFAAGPLREVFCRLKAFPKAPGNQIGEYVLDANDSATLNVEFANGALGVIHTSRWVGGHQNRLFLKIAGTLGTIEMDSDVSTEQFKICHGKNLDTCTWETVTCKPVPNNYQRFVTAIRSGKSGEPDFQRGAEIQRVLDACLESNASGAPVKL